MFLYENGVNSVLTSCISTRYVVNDVGIVSIVCIHSGDYCQLGPIWGVLHHLSPNGAHLLDHWAVVIDVCYTHSHLQ